MWLVPLAVALGAAIGWSDPIPLAATTAAVPPAIAVTADRVQVFWLDRRGPTASTGDLWHTVLSLDGRPVRPPARIRTGVDTRLAFPAAVSWNGRVAAAWMSRSPEGVAVEIGILDPHGNVQAILRPDPVPREEAGRIALSVSKDGTLHAAWSQFDGERRRIWYARIRADDLRSHPPVAVAAGDAPALLLTPEPSLFWWESVGAGGFRLMMGVLDTAQVSDRKALTGTISLVAPLPVLPAVVGGERIVLIPTLERAFSTSGQLYAIRLRPLESTPVRVSLLGRTRVSDVSLAQREGMAVAVWSQPVGRRQNSELYGARLLGGEQGFLDTPSRLTYTIPGSLRPAAAITAGRPAAVWLEVTGFGEFSLSFGTSAAPRRHRFLLGITELDPFRPGALLAFAALTAVSILPIALLLAAATLLPAAVLLAVAQMLVAPFRRLDTFLRRPVVRVAALIAAAVAIQIAARGLIPGRPTPLLLAVPALCLTPPVVALLAKQISGSLGRGLIVGGLVLLSAMVALFTWGAGQLSQF